MVSNDTEAKEFSTLDIEFAVYLMYKHFLLTRIEAIARHKSRFHFSGVTDEIKDEWLQSHNGAGEVKSIIGLHRHLLKDSRDAERAFDYRVVPSTS